MISARLKKIAIVARLRTALFVCGLFALGMPVLNWWHPEGDNFFTVYLDGKEMGSVAYAERAEELYREVRSDLASEQQGLSLLPMKELTVSGQELLVREVDDEQDVKTRMRDAISGELRREISKAYTIKVEDTMVNVAGAEEATRLLQETIDTYDTEGKFQVELVGDLSRELNVLVPRITRRDDVEEEEDLLLGLAGASLNTDDSREWNFDEEEIGFDSFDYGIEEMGFAESVEIAEAYLPNDSIQPFETAKNRLTELQELQQIYKVKSGDTLSKISLEVGLPLDEIIALNDTLENENSIINVDQELLITVPEPELSVLWTETCRTDEVFDLPTEYIYNDEWYTTKSVTLQQPSAGYHETVSLITRRNTDEEAREVLYEEVGVEAVGKVVEVGTKVPPTYIKPLSGGRISSGFGRRQSPGGIGSSNHQGIDIATPTGTSIWASSGGTVGYAGWSGGYGYLVTINHPDGWQTRYAHLSKIYVSVGQYVNQGQVIAASGSTGNSTGPHLHFELRIGGVAIDPRTYVNLY
ncbi:MAG: M23 family metallopeptidase [Lachnospiraceae bacterium]|nr:M23 family metallopeptidase [Lachnospiraceae bacterium]